MSVFTCPLSARENANKSDGERKREGREREREREGERGRESDDILSSYTNKPLLETALLPTKAGSLLC